jgi:hypothetical protein
MTACHDKLVDVEDRDPLDVCAHQRMAGADMEGHR